MFLFFREEVFIWISFFINYLVLTAITYYHLNIEKNYSPFLSSFIIFNFLFFLVAPIIQISSMESNGSIFPNGFPYRTWDIIFTNFLILIFNCVFLLTYLHFKKKHITENKKSKNRENSFSTPLSILILFTICLIIFFFNYDFLADEFLRPSWMKLNISKFSLLLRKKVLFLIPLGVIVITYRYLKEKNTITDNTIISFLILILLVILLLVFKNPFTEKRNALGPIYITLIYLFYPKLINSNAKTFLLLFISMILFFPLMSALTHVNASFNDVFANPQIVIKSFTDAGGFLNTFNKLHYDAFANIMATVEYVSINGFSLGYQLLSTLLFFIPRSIWQSKPLSTGEHIGNYLIENHHFSFNNLSNPIVSEGYINFGLIGVFFMAILLSYFMIKFMKWLNSDSSLKEIIAFYFAIHLIFLLRGDFTNGVVYFIGTFIGVYLIPISIIKLLKNDFRKV